MKAECKTVETPGPAPMPVGILVSVFVSDDQLEVMDLDDAVQRFGEMGHAYLRTRKAQLRAARAHNLSRSRTAEDEARTRQPGRVE